MGVDNLFTFRLLHLYTYINMKYQKGFAPLVIILLVVLGVGIVGGGYVVVKDKKQQKQLEAEKNDLKQFNQETNYQNPDTSNPSPETSVNNQTTTKSSTTAKQETVQILGYISKDQVGIIKIGAQMPSQDSLLREGYLLTEKIISAEGSPQKIYIVTQNGKQLLTFYHRPDFNVGIHNIMVQSSGFTTDKGIAIGSTISDFIKAYPTYRLWHTLEEGEKFVLNTAIDAPTPQFFLKREDLADSKKDFWRKEINISDFNADAKITEIRVY